jgi:hypothetical protein
MVAAYAGDQADAMVAAPKASSMTIRKAFIAWSPQGAPLPSMRAPAACTDVVGTTAIDAEKSIINRIMKRMFHLAPASSR